MNQYSHAVLAYQLLSIVKPTKPDEYLWGSIAPDIRYLAGMQRERTHLPDEEINGWLRLFPNHQSFIQGYRVHCMLDKIDTVKAITRPFPLRLLKPILRKRLRSRQVAVAIELYFQRIYPHGVFLNGNHNPILDILGITPHQSIEFSETMKSYLGAPSYNTAVKAFTRLGIIADVRIDRYAVEYHRLEKNALMLSILMRSVKNAQLESLAHKQYINLSDNTSY